MTSGLTPSEEDAMHEVHAENAEKRREYEKARRERREARPSWRDVLRIFVRKR